VKGVLELEGIKLSLQDGANGVGEGAGGGAILADNCVANVKVICANPAVRTVG